MKAALEQNGYKIYTVPEVATIVFSNGAEWNNLSVEQQYTILEEIIKLQMSLEDAFVSVAEASGKPSVVIMDRGLLDNEAYVPFPEMWNLILDKNSWNIIEMRDKRYDKVLHLVTAAIGAEKYYTTENNTARRETVHEAAELDRKIQRSYIGHHDVSVIDNTTDFSTKVERCKNSILHKVGLYSAVSKPILKKRYILSDNFNFENVKSRISDVSIDITFLDPSKFSSNSYVYRRGQNGVYEYFLKDSDQIERVIDPEEYLNLSTKKDPKTKVLHKDLKYFLYNHDYFCYSQVNGKKFLEVSIEKGRELKLPNENVKRELNENEMTDYDLSKE